MTTVENGFRNQKNPEIFVLNGQSPEDVAKHAIGGGKQKEPFYVFDMDEAYRRIQHFREMMPRVKIFYAMKANDTEKMLKLAVALGVGFDCASPGEIYKIRQLNVSPTSIIFAMPTKTPEQMIYARESGVKHTTFDTSYELKKIKEYWPDAKLLIRLRIDSVSEYSLGEKFGCDFDTEAVNLLEEAASLGLQVVGVAFHVGSVCTSWDSYRVGLQQARQLFDHEASAGRGMDIVDIGGGFHAEPTDQIDPVSAIINKSLEDLFPDPSVQVIAEPGRYICDSAFTLYCSINNVRRIKQNDKTINMVYLNDGSFGTMRFPERWHLLSKFLSDEEKYTGNDEETLLWGPSCDSTDRVHKDFNISLPNISPRDWIVVKTHGAYTITLTTSFSCFVAPLIRPVASVELWNKLKTLSIFKPSEFIFNPNLTVPLPSTLPPLLSRNGISALSHTPTLHD